ncbi:alpha/beta hydrolase family protein [Pseudoalteromonas fenneropenaei]|uniref:Alpha/beta hydrolase family protein n=1 Tax=Pseudoalteromonas fenneropenaei TaxID=1737459 RepID=A0ABV7CLL6_9GAMM
MEWSKLLLAASLASSSAFAVPADPKLVEIFSHSETMKMAKLSPDGKFLALAFNYQDETAIGVLSLPELKSVSSTKLGGPSTMGPFFWANDNRLVSQVMEKRGWLSAPVTYGEYYAFDYNGKRGKLIYGARAGEMQTGSRIKKAQSTEGWGELVDPLYEDSDYILLSSTPWSTDLSALPELIKVNVKTGAQRGFGKKAPIPHGQFILDNNKEPLLVSGRDKLNNIRTYLYKADNNSWQELNTLPEMNPLAVTDDNRYVWVLARTTKDKSGLYKLDTQTSTLAEVFTDSEYDVASAVYSSDTNQVIALTLASPTPTYIVIDNKHPEAQLLKDLIATFPGEEVTIFNRTEDGSQVLVLIGSDISDGVLYLYNTKKNTIRELYTFRAATKQLPLAQTESFTFTTSDKLTVQSYFTPARQDLAGKKQKMVVLVHGGPHGIRDTWSFDPEVHLLSQHGYNVLRVNYRGSGGFGQSFEEAGYRQWGNAIQRDISEAVAWTIKNKGVSKDHICIMGASFGGYSAIMNPILNPDLYQCAVANVGVYDLAMMYNEGDIPRMRTGKAYLEEVIGRDEAELAAYSPVNHVEKLNIPLFLAHGEKDQRAPVEHYEALTKALDKAGKPYESLVEAKEGHGFYNEQIRGNYYIQVLNFLDKHLKDE